MIYNDQNLLYIHYIYLLISTNVSDYGLCFIEPCIPNFMGTKSPHRDRKIFFLTLWGHKEIAHIAHIIVFLSKISRSERAEKFPFNY